MFFAGNGTSSAQTRCITSRIFSLKSWIKWHFYSLDLIPAQASKGMHVTNVAWNQHSCEYRKVQMLFTNKNSKDMSQQSFSSIICH